jgi:S-adenosylmethionine uptake transporter
MLKQQQEKKTYIIGVSWFVLSIIISVINDTTTKILGGSSSELSSIDITFFRFVFSTLILIPIVFWKGLSSIKTNNFSLHLIRGTMLFLGISGWNYGLSSTHLSTVTIISFSIPLFTLVLGHFFLSEKITFQRWIATLIGFIGILIIVKPSSNSISGINMWGVILICSAVAFAGLDVINKIFVSKETMFCMILYSSISTALFALPFISGKGLAPYDYVLFTILGFNANLILLCLLKSFSYIDATSAAPYRYLEIIISSIISNIVFNDSLTTYTLYGSMILIPSAFFVVKLKTNKVAKLAKKESIKA